VAELFELTEEGPQRAVWCVQHLFEPTETVKMRADRLQTRYRRKAWSAVMLFNCEHPYVQRGLGVWEVNHLYGGALHAMDWANHEIGALPEEWHWLHGLSTVEQCPNPKLVHFTHGTPDIPAYMDVPFADEWFDYYARLDAEAAAD